MITERGMAIGFGREPPGRSVFEEKDIVLQEKTLMKTIFLLISKIRKHNDMCFNDKKFHNLFKNKQKRLELPLQPELSDLDLYVAVGRS